MSLKDLPKSLVDSVSEVITNSVERDALITDRVFKEGLQTFGVEGIHQLSESDQKALFSWAQKEISRIMEAALVAESDCACCDDMAEDDMPGDSVYHKDGEEESEKKKDLGETLEENVAILPNQLAGNGAVGVRANPTETPVHADVIRDFSPTEGTHEYRMLVQFPTNARSMIVPPPHMPGAPSVEALKTVVEGLPFFGSVVEDALTAAADMPVKQPQFKGQN